MAAQRASLENSLNRSWKARLDVFLFFRHHLDQEFFNFFFNRLHLDKETSGMINQNFNWMDIMMKSKKSQLLRVLLRFPI